MCQLKHGGCFAKAFNGLTVSMITFANLFTTHIVEMIRVALRNTRMLLAPYVQDFSLEDVWQPHEAHSMASKKYLRILTAHAKSRIAEPYELASRAGLDGVASCLREWLRWTTTVIKIPPGDRICAITFGLVVDFFSKF